MAQISHVDSMACHAEERQRNGEMVDEGQEELERDDGINEASEQLAGEDRMLFDQL